MNYEELDVLVLMSTYNGEDYIREQLDSIFSQTVNERIHVLIRDDGSTDNTVNIINEYLERTNISVVQGGNIGAARSFAWLMKNAPKATYYAFADQDDVWKSFKIERAIQMLEKTHGSLYGSSYNIVDYQLKPLSVICNPYEKGLVQFLFWGCTIIGCTMVMTAEFFEKIKELWSIINHENDEIKGIFHDAFCLGYAELYNLSIVYDDCQTMLYRQHDGNVFGCRKKKGIIGKIKDFSFYEFKRQNFGSLYSRALIAYTNCVGVSKDNYAILIAFSKIRSNIKSRWIIYKKIKFTNGKHTWCGKIVNIFALVLGWR